MALKSGDIEASYGMAKAIYDRLRDVLEPTAAAGGGDIEKLRDIWKKLSYAIASGVIEHITGNIEVIDIKTKGDVTTAVTGAITPSYGAGTHTHGFVLEGKQTGVEFTQSNDGKDHVR